MLEIPLSVGSKLELLCLCQISVYFPVHSRICPRMHIEYTCILAIYNVHDRGAEVLHFSAFICSAAQQKLCACMDKITEPYSAHVASYVHENNGLVCQHISYEFIHEANVQRART